MQASKEPTIWASGLVGPRRQSPRRTRQTGRREPLPPRVRVLIHTPCPTAYNSHQVHRFVDGDIQNHRVGTRQPKLQWTAEIIAVSGRRPEDVGTVSPQGYGTRGDSSASGLSVAFCLPTTGILLPKSLVRSTSGVGEWEVDWTPFLDGDDETTSSMSPALLSSWIRAFVIPLTTNHEEAPINFPGQLFGLSEAQNFSILSLFLSAFTHFFLFSGFGSSSFLDIVCRIFSIGVRRG